MQRRALQVQPPAVDSGSTPTQRCRACKALRQDAGLPPEAQSPRRDRSKPAVHANALRVAASPRNRSRATRQYPALAPTCDAETRRPADEYPSPSHRAPPAIQPHNGSRLHTQEPSQIAQSEAAHHQSAPHLLLGLRVPHSIRSDHSHATTHLREYSLPPATEPAESPEESCPHPPLIDSQRSPPATKAIAAASIHARTQRFSRPLRPRRAE